MNQLHKTPTSQLLAELNARAEQRQFSVACLPGGPYPTSLPKFGVYVEGEMRPTPRGIMQSYRAICSRRDDADNIADLLNQQETQRADAAKQ